MKKSIISAVLALVILVGVGGSVAVNTANAQNVTLQQIISLFIALGIIPADKVAIAEAAVGLPITTTTTTTSTNSNQPLIAVVGNPTISSNQTYPQNGYSTTTLVATFNVQIQASGDNFYFGSPSVQPFDFSVGKNGAWATCRYILTPNHSPCRLPAS